MNAMTDARNEVIQDDDQRGEYIPHRSMVTHNVHNYKFIASNN